MLEAKEIKCPHLHSVGVLNPEERLDLRVEIAQHNGRALAVQRRCHRPAAQQGPVHHTVVALSCSVTHKRLLEQASIVQESLPPSYGYLHWSL